ncbi:MAG: precorrin-6A/cobalt-precorrin-6A reductase [Cyanobacteria bacterium P01_E01_bin.6]
MTKIWLIGGTQESRILAQRLVSARIPTTVTMTTDAARSLYPESDLLTLAVDRLTPETLPEFLHRHAIGAILDASHPFAVQISELAIATAQAHDIPYLRFERPSTNGASASDAAPSHAEESLAMQPNPLEPQPRLVVPSIDGLLAGEMLIGRRVLLTIGYRLLPLFQPWQEKATLFARILPSQTALAAALDAGFTGDRLIALRPPIQVDLERALWNQWSIETVVTKASGAPGGEDTKRQLAQELGIQLITIARPPVAYPAQTQDVDEAIALLMRLAIGSGRSALP